MMISSDPGQDESTSDPGLHSLLQGRFSPLTFDSDHELVPAQVNLLLDAARWAPSAGNSQPWAFFIALRGSAEHHMLVRHLAASSSRWAPDASALVVNIAHRYIDDSDVQYSEFADYDLGQAVAHMTLQAQAMGLVCRQFRAFNLDALTSSLGVEPGWQILSMVAIGRTPTPQRPDRYRRSIADLRSAGRR